MRRGTDGTGGPENYYYHQDDLFNVVALTDETGAVVERYDYGDCGAPEIYSPAGTLLPPGAFYRIRQQTRTGRPCGSALFLDQLQRALGRSVRPQRAGRRTLSTRNSQTALDQDEFNW